MSIILKGIDLPKEGEMHLIISKNGMVCGAEYPCKIKHAYPLNLEAKAIQIPKGHGDIKDINTVEDELDERCGQLSAEIVRNAPTILEEEK